MKALFYAAFAAALTATTAVSSCSGQKETAAEQQGPYTLVLPAGDDNGMMAYLTDFNTDEKIDSVIIVNGSASFAGTVDSIRMVRVLIDGCRRGLAVLEPGDIAIDSADRMPSGTPLNDRFRKFAADQDSIMTVYNNATASETTPDSVAAKNRAAAMEAYNNLTSEAIRENESNALGDYLLLQECYALTPAQMDSIMGVYPAIKPGARLLRLREAMDLKAQTMPGKKFKDFEVVNDSVRYRLSNHVGKGHYTLVDFWASWCGPCIRETETIKRIYNAYKEKGLEVLGVAVWDEPQNTLKAIKDHELPWAQIINTQRIATDVYGISSIPCIILFDPEGVIVCRDLQGSDLERAVAEAMSPKSETAQ